MDELAAGSARSLRPGADPQLELRDRAANPSPKWRGCQFAQRAADAIRPPPHRILRRRFIHTIPARRPVRTLPADAITRRLRRHPAELTNHRTRDAHRTAIPASDSRRRATLE